MRKLTREEFIAKAVKKWGDKNDYSSTEYNGFRSPVTVVCKKHGPFTQNASNHLCSEGCPKCAAENRPFRVAGFGRNNSYEKVFGTVAYQEWKNMMHRCYDTKKLKKYPSYIGCTVCDDWRDFPGFKKWYDENGVSGWSLDKDLIKKGNRVYCPQYCVYVPKSINSLIVNRKADRGLFPLGVTAYKGRYRARLSRDGREAFIGLFDTPEDAFAAYKKAKEEYIKKVAQEYYGRGEITKRLYDALMRYEVEITD